MNTNHAIRIATKNNEKLKSNLRGLQGFDGTLQGVDGIIQGVDGSFGGGAKSFFFLYLQ